MMRSRVALGAALTLLAASTVSAQWVNRYPKLAGYGHHIYLEGYELPLLTNGPIDPAESPDGRTLVFASRGWLWLFDPATGTATRLTTASGVDSRPAWSPDGREIAFLRDDGRSLVIMGITVATRAERVLVREDAILLDPAYAPDGRSLFYSSGIAGDLDLWRLDLQSGAKSRVTTAVGSSELHPMPTPDGTALLYLAKTRAGSDQIRRRSLSGGEEVQLASGNIVSMTRGSVSPDGRTLALTWPTQEGYELRLASTAQSGAVVQVLREPKLLPLTPRFSSNGRWIWFSFADAQQRLQLARVPADGGPMQRVPVTRWDWGAATATLRIVTTMQGSPSPGAARVTVSAADGHPIVPDSGQIRFDGQNGIPFFYSNGTIDVTVPAGTHTVSAVQGIATPVASQRVTVSAGETRTVTVGLTPVWDARASGWMSGEHHFHLNYGGPYTLEPDALIAMGNAEDLDVLTPMLANLAQRFEDQPLFAYRRTGARPQITWAQEVRSHFFGHIGLINTPDLFWPWIWGPGYDVHSRDDRPNAEPLAWARARGGITSYVHPFSGPQPFASPASMRGIPLGFIADAVQGQINTIELACLWSDERGTADLWYRVLNLGIPMALSAGTDAMNNLYRTMAIGTTRVYVKPERPGELASYFEGLKAGRSFVSTGPMLDFHVAAMGPGQVIARSTDARPFELVVHSAVPVDTVEIVVNGAVVQRMTGFAAPGSRTYRGRVRLPEGGWIAARVSGPKTVAWPAMDSYAYAHTAPVWIDRVGSTVVTARVTAARELLQALDVADQAVDIGYGDAARPTLREHYAKARRLLTEWARETP